MAFASEIASPSLNALSAKYGFEKTIRALMSKSKTVEIEPQDRALIREARREMSTLIDSAEASVSAEINSTHTQKRSFGR